MPATSSYGELDTSCPVNWSHPLNRGRVGWWSGWPQSGWSGGVTLRDVVGPNNGVLTNGPVWVAGPTGFGRAVGFDGTDDYVTVPSSAPLQLTTKGTVRCWVRRAGTQVYAGLAGTGELNTFLNGYNLQVYNGDIFGLTGSSSFVTVANPLTTGAWSYLAFTWDGSTLALYHNGVSVATASQASNASGSHPFVIGAANTSLNDVEYPFNGSLASVSVWNRAMSAGQIVEDYRQSRLGNPDTLRWVRPLSNGTTASGGSTTTLTASAGTLTLSGQTALLKRALDLTASAGSLTISGQSAALDYNRVVAAAVGTYSLNGQSAGLYKNRTLTAATGSYSLSGQDAGSVRLRNLTAAAGSYTFTGQSATLTKADTSSAGGSYTLTGQSANLLYNRKVVAAVGNYSLSGQSATLTKAKVPLTASAGTFTLSGQSAGLVAHHIIGSDYGSYLLTGKRANLLKPGDHIPNDSNLPSLFA